MQNTINNGHIFVSQDTLGRVYGNNAQTKSSKGIDIALRVAGCSLIALGIIGAGVLLTVSQVLPVGLAVLLGIGITCGVLPLIGTVLCIKTHYLTKNHLSYNRVNVSYNPAHGIQQSPSSEYNKNVNPGITSRRFDNAHVPVQINHAPQYVPMQPSLQLQPSVVQPSAQQPRPNFKEIRLPTNIPTIHPVVAPEVPKAYSFDEATTQWIKNCKIEAYCDAKTVLLFKQKLAVIKYKNDHLPISSQIELFEEIMGVKNVSAADFIKLKECLKEEQSLTQFENDPVLKHCTCPLTLEYPREAVIEPTAKTTIYEKSALEQELEKRAKSPITGLPLKKAQLKNVPEFESIVQHRLFEVIILKK